MLIVLYAHLIYMFSEVTVKPVNYEALTDDLIENYAPEENPELYSLYTSMLNHLMKIFKLKHSTAVKLLLKVEEKLGIHLMRDREMTNMKMLNLKIDDDVKRYFRTLYWTTKLPLETLDEIIKLHGDVNSRLVKEFMKEHGQMSEDKYKNFSYSQKYYKEHRKELLEKKRIYRRQKQLQKLDEKVVTFGI